jgi:hypothetical protein
LGGFESITLKASNHTDYKVERIVARLTYWQADGEIYKTEEVNFSGVLSQDFLITAAPGSDRGIRLTIEILKITAPEFQFCYDSESAGNIELQATDPWKCSP